MEWVKAGTLRENPHNWRRHPEGQLSALREVIADPEVGWAGALLWNKRTKRLIDGHGRLKIVQPNEYVPVLIGDWSEEAEQKILLTLDPLSALATPDADALRALLETVPMETDALARLAEDLEGQLEKLARAAEKDTAAARIAGDESAALSERYLVLVTCVGEQQQRQLLERFMAEGLECRAMVG